MKHLNDIAEFEEEYLDLDDMSICYLLALVDATGVVIEEWLQEEWSDEDLREGYKPAIFTTDASKAMRFGTIESAAQYNYYYHHGKLMVDEHIF